MPFKIIISPPKKDYQVKEQCNNCTYQNGQFAEECEMCGEPLSHRPRTSSGQPESSFKIRDGTNRSSRDYY
jgi:methionyl-tRNA synthetase